MRVGKPRHFSASLRPSDVPRRVSTVRHAASGDHHPLGEDGKPKGVQEWVWFHVLIMRLISFQITFIFSKEEEEVGVV